MSEIKRVNYFTSQMLEEEDFRTEQTYHRESRCRHNQFLHTWGVADGLEVKKKGDNAVSIGAGMAIDRNGHEIFLAGPREFNLGSAKPKSTVFLTIAWAEATDETDFYGGEGQLAKTPVRITERPKVEVSDKPIEDGLRITLASVSITGDGKAGPPDNSVRQYAGSKVGKLREGKLLDGTMNVLETPEFEAGNRYLMLRTKGGNLYRAGIKLRVHDDTHGWTIEEDERVASNGLNVLRHDHNMEGKTALFIHRQTGRICIGDTNPQATLDVRGDLAIEGDLSGKAVILKSEIAFNDPAGNDPAGKKAFAIKRDANFLRVLAQPDLPLYPGSKQVKNALNVAPSGVVGIGGDPDGSALLSVAKTDQPRKWSIHAGGNIKADGSIEAASLHGEHFGGNLFGGNKFRTGAGQTPAGNTPWKQWGNEGVTVHVDTSSASFDSTKPVIYCISLAGKQGHAHTMGGNSVYNPSSTGFDVYVKFQKQFTGIDRSQYNEKNINEPANVWHIHWIGIQIL